MSRQAKTENVASLKTMQLLAIGFLAVVGGSAVFAMRQVMSGNAYPTYGSAGLRFSGAAIVFMMLWGMAALLTAFAAKVRVPISRDAIPPASITAKIFSTIGSWDHSISRNQVLLTVLAGLVSSFGHMLLYPATKHVEGSTSYAIFVFGPLITGALGKFLNWRDDITPAHLVCAALASFGVAVLSGGRLSNRPEHLPWLALVLASTFVFAWSTLLLGSPKTGSILGQGAIFLLAGSVPQWAGFWFAGETLPAFPLPPVPTKWLAYLILVSSGVCLFVHLWLMRKDFIKALSIAYLQPIIALGIDCWGEPHPMETHTVVGVSIVVVAVFLYGRLKKPLAPPTAPVPMPSNN